VPRDEISGRAHGRERPCPVQIPPFFGFLTLSDSSARRGAIEDMPTMVLARTDPKAWLWVRLRAGQLRCGEEKGACEAPLRYLAGTVRPEVTLQPQADSGDRRNT